MHSILPKRGRRRAASLILQSETEDGSVVAEAKMIIMNSRKCKEKCYLKLSNDGIAVLDYLTKTEMTIKYALNSIVSFLSNETNNNQWGFVVLDQTSKQKTHFVFSFKHHSECIMFKARIHDMTFIFQDRQMRKNESDFVPTSEVEEISFANKEMKVKKNKSDFFPANENKEISFANAEKQTTNKPQNSKNANIPKVDSLEFVAQNNQAYSKPKNEQNKQTDLFSSERPQKKQLDNDFLLLVTDEDSFFRKQEPQVVQKTESERESEILKQQQLQIEQQQQQLLFLQQQMALMQQQFAQQKNATNEL